MRKIIVIDGTDGCGKKTQCSLLTERLKADGINAVEMSFPNYESGSSVPVQMYLGGEVCQKADDFSPYQSSILFTVDRLMSMEMSKALLAEDGVLVLDRYTTSNIIHQGGKISDLAARDEYYDWLLKLEYITLKLPRPDMVLFLDMPVSLSQSLANKRTSLKNKRSIDIHECDAGHLSNAYDSAIYAAKKYRWQSIQCGSPRAVKSKSDIAEEIYYCVKKNLKY